MARYPAADRTAPAARYEAITASDSTTLTYSTRSIYVGNSGDVVAVGEDGAATTFKNVVAGTMLNIVAVRVNATSTTATDLVALY